MPGKGDGIATSCAVEAAGWARTLFAAAIVAHGHAGSKRSALDLGRGRHIANPPGFFHLSVGDAAAVIGANERIAAFQELAQADGAAGSFDQNGDG